MIRRLIRRYDAEVAATDAAIGVLLEALGWARLLDESIVVLTSDHGEALGRHGYWFGHGEMLYDGTLHVPLVVRAPGRIPAGTRLTGIVPLEDVVPTVLGLAGVPVDAAEVDGSDLSPLLVRGGVQRAPTEVALHATDYQSLHQENPRRAIPGREGRWLAVRTNGWKLIRIPVAPGEFAHELYRLDDDPLEVDDAAGREPDRVAALSALLDAVAGRFGPAPVPDQRLPDRQVEDALRSLGYLSF
jgi:arylsulfatase A-like enzyme